MSSLENAINRRAYKERAQPQSRRMFGLLEKHKDYVVCAKAFHKKEDALHKLKEKAAFRNPDEFYFKMIKTKTGTRYTQEELMLMRTHDMEYILQKSQCEKKKIERLTATLHCLDNHGSTCHVYYAEDSLVRLRVKMIASEDEAKKIQSNSSRNGLALASKAIPKHIQSSFNAVKPIFPCGSLRKMSGSYRDLEARKSRVKDLEKMFMNLSLQKELQKKGRKRKLHVYKWRAERKQ